ncbi:hypothetical protein P9112_011867 [Eukaryota sp. TZLM1-RC]
MSRCRKDLIKKEKKLCREGIFPAQSISSIVMRSRLASGLTSSSEPPIKQSTVCTTDSNVQDLLSQNNSQSMRLYAPGTPTCETTSITPESITAIPDQEFEIEYDEIYEYETVSESGMEESEDEAENCERTTHLVLQSIISAPSISCLDSKTSDVVKFLIIDEDVVNGMPLEHELLDQLQSFVTKTVTKASDYLENYCVTNTLRMSERNRSNTAQLASRVATRQLIQDLNYLPEHFGKPAKLGELSSDSSTDTDSGDSDVFNPDELVDIDGVDQDREFPQEIEIVRENDEKLKNEGFTRHKVSSKDASFKTDLMQKSNAVVEKGDQKLKPIEKVKTNRNQIKKTSKRSNQNEKVDKKIHNILEEKCAVIAEKRQLAKLDKKLTTFLKIKPEHVEVNKKEKRLLLRRAMVNCSTFFEATHELTTNQDREDSLEIEKGLYRINDIYLKPLMSRMIQLKGQWVENGIELFQSPKGLVTELLSTLSEGLVVKHNSAVEEKTKMEKCCCSSPKKSKTLNETSNKDSDNGFEVDETYCPICHMNEWKVESKWAKLECEGVCDSTFHFHCVGKIYTDEPELFFCNDCAECLG